MPSDKSLSFTAQFLLLILSRPHCRCPSFAARWCPAKTLFVLLSGRNPIGCQFKNPFDASTALSLYTFLLFLDSVHVYALFRPKLKPFYNERLQKKFFVHRLFMPLTIPMLSLPNPYAPFGLSGHRDRELLRSYICGLHPKGAAFEDGTLQPGDQLMKVGETWPMVAPSGAFQLTFFDILNKMYSSLDSIVLWRVGLIIFSMSACLKSTAYLFSSYI